MRKDRIVKKSSDRGGVARQLGALIIGASCVLATASCIVDPAQNDQVTTPPNNAVSVGSFASDDSSEVLDQTQPLPLPPPSDLGPDQMRARIESVRDQLIAHAPYKQVSTSGRYNRSIGRTPATACDAILFFADYLQRFPADGAARRKALELADWVAGQQQTDRSRPSYGGVPSAPDLSGERGAYYYALDAGFCADAFLALYDLEQRPRDLETATRFGAFILETHAEHRRLLGGGSSAGFCEFVIDAGRAPRWNCDAHVKVLAALPALGRLSSETGDPAFAAAARSARSYLTPGLQGFWEFAAAPNPQQCARGACAPQWGRVQGPYREPNLFAFGDSMAYALRGLYLFDRTDASVAQMYRSLTALSSAPDAPAGFDARIALPGYIDIEAETADPRSAYYDLVTIGILDPVRVGVAPSDAARAYAFATTLPASAAELKWGLGFDGARFVGDYTDLVTLSEIGRMYLRRWRE